MKRFLLLIILIVLFPASARAAVICVINGSQLKTALQTAANNGQPDQIRLKFGTYVHPDGGTFTYKPVSGQDHNLEMSGGWSPTVTGGQCARQTAVNHALTTVITTANNVRLLDIQPPEDSSMSVSISRLALVGGETNSGGGAGLRYYAQEGQGGMLRIENVAFIDNSGGSGAALSILNDGRTRVYNSLFHGNLTSGGVVTLVTVWNGGIAHVTNNTVINNLPTGGNNGAGLEVWASGEARALVANNHLWGNSSRDLVLRAHQGSQIIYRNNNYRHIHRVHDATSSLEGSNNISLQTTYVTGMQGYVPAPGSPLINAGTQPPPLLPVPVPWQHSWTVGTTDMLNRTRVLGPRVDIGAYEAPWVDAIFGNGFQ